MAEINNTKVIVDYNEMQAIADAIRAHTNSTQGITINEMPLQISGISDGEQATPEISVSSSGLITATAGDKSATKQLTTQAAKTITPSISSQTVVASGVYTTGEVTVAAIPSNYEDVTTETTAYTNELADLVSQISALETALQGKASGGSGGGSVETCTVTIVDYGCGTSAAYNTFENGALKAVLYENRTNPESYEVEVAKGSVLLVYDSQYYISGIVPTCDSGITWRDSTFFGSCYFFEINESGSILFEP